MYKVFINNKTLYLLTKQKTSDSSVIKDNSLVFVNKDSIISAINNLCENEQLSTYYLVANSDKDILKQMKKLFKYIKAAGGVVQNSEGKILLIYRNNFWDLPKGKIEKKEKKYTAALREVSEECGLNDCEIINKLSSTYHMYKMNNEWVLKKTFWFKMLSSQEKLTPQLEEGIEHAKWYTKKEVLEKMQLNMYASLKELLQNYFTID